MNLSSRAGNWTVFVYRSTYSLSLSYGAASRGCGEDRESNAVIEPRRPTSHRLVPADFINKSKKRSSEDMGRDRPRLWHA